MTPFPLSWQPAPSPLEYGGGGPEHGRQAVSAEELAALHRAACAGEAAAGWVRELAARQAAELHAWVLAQTAGAIERTSSHEIVPGGDGELTEEPTTTPTAERTELPAPTAAVA